MALLAFCALLNADERRDGFASPAEEWWHFTLQDEPYPDTYFDFPVSNADGQSSGKLGAL